MRTFIFVLLVSGCYAVAAAAQAATAAEAPVVAEASCDESQECGFEESALVQRKSVLVHSASEGFPDLKKIVNKVTGAVDEATAKANEFIGDALTTGADTMNRTLAKLEVAVLKYTQMVNRTAKSCQDGVTGLLAKTFKVEVRALYASQADMERVITLVGQADDIVRASLLTVESTTKAMDIIPGKVNLFNDKVNTTFKEVIDTCQRFSTAIRDMRSIFEEAYNRSSAKPPSLLQMEAGERRKLAYFDSADVVHSHAALLAVHHQVVDPRVVMATLNGALAASKDELTAFSQSFGNAFDTLSESVKEFSKGKFSADGSAKVIAAFGDVKARAHEIADNATVAFAQLFGSIDKGAKREGLPKGAGRGLAPGLLAAALAIAGLVRGGAW